MDEFIDCVSCDDVMDLVDIIEIDGSRFLKFKCLECDAVYVIKQG